MTYPLWGYFMWLASLAMVGFWLYSAWKLRIARKQLERLIQRRQQSIDLEEVIAHSLKGRNNGSKVNTTQDRRS